MTKKVAAAFDVYALSKALREALAEIVTRIESQTKQKIISEICWTAINDDQNSLIGYYEIIDDEEFTTLDELQAWVRDTAEELNEILAEHGFSIRLEAWQKSPGRFGVVAIYDITIEWWVTGETTDDDGESYEFDGRPFFHLPDPEAGLEFYEVNGRVIVKIPGKRDGDYLCLTLADRQYEQFELIAEAKRLRALAVPPNRSYEYGGVVMPNVLFDSEQDNPIDISWLIGLQANLTIEDGTVRSWIVKQAKMQAKFAMGPKGARAKVAVALGLECLGISIPVPDYIANHDLLVWMERDGVETAPFFVIYVPKESFADHTVDLSEID